MKTNWISLVLIVLLLCGCASTHGKFDSRYLPGAVPDQPSVRIDFNPSQNQIIANYLRSSKFRNDAALFWLDPDRAYLNLEGAEILSIDTADASTSVLSVEDKAEIARALSQKVNVQNTASEKDVVSQLVGSLFSYAGQHYRGEVKDVDQRVLKVEIEAKETRDDASTERATCASARLVGAFTGDKDAAIPVEWAYHCEWMPRSIADVKVPQLLRKVQIAPSGKSIFYDLTLFGAQMSPAGDKLVMGYPVISSSVCPDWTRIALLRGSGEKYWIEIFPFGKISR